MPRFPLFMLLTFALTLFTSATLLFLVQPMIGKMILPLLGGTPEVWNTCMVFFQAMLLVGYGYAHVSTRWLGVRRQAVVHIAVLVLPLLLFALAGPIAVNKRLIVGGANPVPAVLLVLLLSVGLPFFVVSTTSPLLQQWFSSTDHPAARDPYFLSTASNLGSMLALVGYPALVEPFLPLAGQRLGWAIGYGLYIVLTGCCVVLLWKAGVAAEAKSDAAAPAAKMDAPPAQAVQSSKPQGKGRRKKDRSERAAELPPAPSVSPPVGTALTGEVTLWRRARWVVLALIPSSLLMGVTTYMTTDIAAIPLLWVLPLGLYLLSFVLVFAKIPEWLQSVLVFLGVVAMLGGIAAAFSSYLSTAPGHVSFLLGVVWLAALGASCLILRLRDPSLMHKVLILALPLMVLLLVFMMLSDIKPKLGYTVTFHLVLMWVVAMVCHGEMVRDRPPTKYLTEFYTWMSFGGVLGGIFNAIVAPLIFNSLAEYSLAMVAACIFLPPLTDEEEEDPGTFGRTTDLVLVGLFTVVGLVLAWLGLREGEIKLERLKSGGWGWPLAAVVLTVAGGAFYVFRRRDRRESRGLDIVLPIALLVLTVGLVWGMKADPVASRLKTIVDWLPGGMTAHQLRLVLTYGLPAVLCYTFVERSLRFGLGVGAILLAGAFTGLFLEQVIFEERSYFGVVKIEEKPEKLYETFVSATSPLFPYFAKVDRDDPLAPDQIHQNKVAKLLLDSRRLLHGTTLHGQQFVMHQAVVPVLAAETFGNSFGDPLSFAAIVLAGSTEDYTSQALSYYHRTGPMGMIMRAYNRTAEDRMGVIGLGTGTLACYGRPGQRMVFYDIDPAIKKITFDSRQYFTFICDARARGVLLDDMVLGDARLEIERWQERDRQLREQGGPRDNSQGDYAVLAVDAFTSDAIPMHLITREAVRLFMSMVHEGGVLTYHISNRYLDLDPVLLNIASAEGLVAYKCSDLAGGYDLETAGKSASTWVVLARKESDLDRLMTQDRWDTKRKEARETLACLAVSPLPREMTALLWELVRVTEDAPPQPARLNDMDAKDWPKGSYIKSPWQPIEPRPEIGVWTDDFSNLLRVMNLW